MSTPEFSIYEPKVTDLQTLQIEIEKWSDPTFGYNRHPSSSLHHLREEVEELIKDPFDRMEYADAMMLLLDTARRAGISAGTLIAETYEKLEINKKRKWSPPNADGFCKHIE